MTSDTAYRKRWALDRAQGVDRSYLDATETAEHVRALLATGLSAQGVARLAGCSPTTVGRIASGQQVSVQRATVRRLLAVRPAAALTPAYRGRVSNAGARRRIRALLALGWTHQHITEHMAVRTSSRLVLHQIGDTVESATHVAVARAYDALAMTPGPSAPTRARAARLGYFPPLAWDDDTLDDPAALPAPGYRGNEHGECAHRGCERRPDGARRHCGTHGSPAARRDSTTPPLDLDEWALLVGSGESPTRAATRCGVSLFAVERAAHRAGRRDLAALAQDALARYVDAGRVA